MVCKSSMNVDYDFWFTILWNTEYKFVQWLKAHMHNEHLKNLNLLSIK